MKRKRFAAPSIFLAGLFFSAIFIFKIASFIGSSGHFRTDYISLSGARADEKMRFRLSKEVNILQLDLAETREKLKSKFPEMDDPVLVRSLPNRLTLSAKMRFPVAQLISRSGRYLLDSEGVILKGSRAGFPVLVCSRLMLGKNSVGKRCNYENVRNGLELLNILKETGMLARYNIRELDINDGEDIKFFLPPAIWVRMGKGDYGAKLQRLSEALSSTAIARPAGNVKYIDLRFGDVIVGTK